MKFIVSFFLIAFFSFVISIYLPWWSIAIPAFLISVIFSMSPFKSFACAFISLFILWSGMSFWISRANENLLIHKISLLILNTDSPVSLLVFTGLIGGLTAGFAALAGSYLRYRPKRK